MKTLTSIPRVSDSGGTFLFAKRSSVTHWASSNVIPDYIGYSFGEGKFP